ncbi:MAG: carbohydrate kinase family protein [Candidatus Thorarchaeota archaeon]|nr:carbohydrate kinase family protein [Candidatus Thorarchaeota archaeon]
MSAEVVSIGRVNVDVVMRVESLTGTDHHFTGQDGYIAFGGSASNFAAQSAKLGVKTALLSCVGSDLYGQVILRELARIGVDTRLVLTLDKQQTGIFTYIYDANRNEMVIVEPGANKFVEKHLLEESMLEGTSTIHLAGAFPMMTRRAAEIATVNGMVLSIDPGRAAASLSFNEVLPHTDLLFLNQRELREYFGMEASEAELRRLAKTFPGILVVKLAERGAVATDGFEYCESRAFDVQVADTMGAGDSFAAGFVAAWTRSENIEQALNVANAVAALTITQRGAQEGQPNLEQLERFLAKYDISIGTIARALRPERRGTK